MASTSKSLLPELIGARLSSVQFVLNDYTRLSFEPEVLPGTELPTLDCFVWPRLHVAGRVWREGDLGYADAFRRLSPGTVVATSEVAGEGIQLALDTGTVVINPTIEEVVVEIAMLRIAEAWMVWRPSETAFEHLG